jgi:hypothetical protein
MKKRKEGAIFAIPVTIGKLLEHPAQNPSRIPSEVDPSHDAGRRRTSDRQGAMTPTGLHLPAIARRMVAARPGGSRESFAALAPTKYASQ